MGKKGLAKGGGLANLHKRRKRFFIVYADSHEKPQIRQKVLENGRFSGGDYLFQKKLVGKRRSYNQMKSVHDKWATVNNVTDDQWRSQRGGGGL